MCFLTEDASGVEIDYDLGCDLPVPPNRCMLTGGALVEFASRGPGITSGLYAMLFFVPSSFTVRPYKEFGVLQVAWRRYQSYVDHCITDCIRVPLDPNFDMNLITSCLHEQIEVRSGHRSKALVLSLTGSTNCALTQGGVLKIQRSLLNLELFVLPPAELIVSQG